MVRSVGFTSAVPLPGVTVTRYVTVCVAKLPVPASVIVTTEVPTDTGVTLPAESTIATVGIPEV